MNGPHVSSFRTPRIRRDPVFAYAILVLWAALSFTALPAESWPGDTWRSQHWVIDMHQHINGTEECIQRALRIMDLAGVGLGVNLSGGTVSRTNGEPSDFERAKALSDRIAPGRFLFYMNLDYRGWDEPDFAERAVRQIEEGHRLGAAGLKEFKRLGLYLRDAKSELIGIDDPKLDGVWKRCGELGMPVSIHVADPKAFWLPYDAQNERWKELKDHPRWWFGDPKQYPARIQLLEALDRVIARHRRTIFVCVHFANNAEDLAWVDAALDRNPNMRADLAARIPEIGRHSPDLVRMLFLKHQDRILFGTDFQVLPRMILGSSGDKEQPTDDDAVEFYRKEWKWLETGDRDWAHMTPIQGDWNISSINLPPQVLRKIYFDNARQLLARSLPFPVIRAHRINRDFVPDGYLHEREWKDAPITLLEREAQDGKVRQALSTKCRVLWSETSLYLSYDSPIVGVTDFGPPQSTERLGMKGENLWDKDVVEAFIAPDPSRIKNYTEYQWAPNGEAMDLKLELPDRDFPWSSGMLWKSRVDMKSRHWIVEVRIPLKSIADVLPTTGTRWRANLYRIDRLHNAFMAVNPPLNDSFHTPDRFAWLEFN